MMKENWTVDTRRRRRVGFLFNLCQSRGPESVTGNNNHINPFVAG